LLVALIAITYTLVSFVIQRKMANTKKVYEMQERIKQKTKELNEIIKSGVKSEELMVKQKEVMSLASESMMNQMKPMIIILPLFFVVYYWLLPFVFPMKPVIVIGNMKFVYTTFFILIVFVFGLLLSLAVMLVDRSMRKKAQQQEQIQSTAPEEGMQK